MSTPIVNLNTLIPFLSHEIDADEVFFNRLMHNFDLILRELEKEGCSGSPENLERLAEIAHKLKVTCRSFGTEKIGQLIEEMEGAAKARDAARTRGLFRAIRDLELETMTTLRTYGRQFFEQGKKRA